MDVREHVNRVARVGLDLAVATLFFYLACRFVGSGPADGGPMADGRGYAAAALGFGSTLVLVFGHLGLYRSRATLLNIGELSRALGGLALTSAVFLAILFLVGASQEQGPVLAGMFAGSFFVALERRLVAAFRKRLQLAGKLGRRVLLYGCGDTGERLMKKIVQAPQLGCTVVGFLDDFVPVGTTVGCRVSQASSQQVQVRVLGRFEDLEMVLRERVVDELLITIPNLTPGKLSRIVETGRRLGTRIGIVPRFDVFRADELGAEDLSGIPVLRPYASRRRDLYQVTKRMLDLGGAIVLMAALLPAWAVAWLLIRLESPGPVLFRQERVGLGGRPFKMYKFRTMYSEAEPYARAPSSTEDPRITRIGRWLRTAGFDETPQLINVVKGEMSLVGPRPEMPFIVGEYGELERQRFQALPGITGLWQLSADRSAEIHENIEYDLYYLRNRSLLLDLAILLETIYFSLSVVTHRVFRMDRVWLMTDRSAEAEEADLAEPANRGFVLAALDQRTNGILPDLWRRVLPSLYELSRHVPVKIVVAERNVDLVDRLMQGLEGRRSLASHRTEFIPHRGRAELHRLGRDARIVVTDLPDLATSLHDGAEIVVVEEDGKPTVLP